MTFGRASDKMKLCVVLSACILFAIISIEGSDAFFLHHNKSNGKSQSHGHGGHSFNPFSGIIS